MFETERRTLERPTKRHYKIIIFGIITHSILLMSIFDIYFQSPVLHGIEPIVPKYVAPARRVVLFISDGLRVDKCFGAKTSNGSPAAPYLRSVAENKGAWGVSHTRVPTESRPGCVAIAAGIYEDVSAITKGWKENPVEFDSVFNRSRYTWCWGSPDMINMFVTKERPTSNVFVDHYSQSDVDFGNGDPSSLDTWVLNRLQSFLKEAERNVTLADLLSNDKIVFFLHLLGADIVGHSRKPWSREYVATLEIVDRVVRDAVSAFENYYGDDNGTAYIFTSDHGMTDWGSHGSSDPEETQTPLLAWGAGIRAPVPIRDNQIGSDEWNVRDRERTDIRQADIAPLMSCLVGIPIPVNSVGVLPLKLLSCREDQNVFCSEAVLMNTKQLAAQFERHWQIKESNSFAMFFHPYEQLHRLQLERKLRSLSQIVENGGNCYREAMELVETILKGIRYFETYDRVSLCFCIVIGFVGWMVYVCLQLGSDRQSSISPAIHRRNDRLVYYVVATLTIILTIFSYFQNEPLTYYVYRIFPVASLTMVFRFDNRSFESLLNNVSRELVVSFFKNVIILMIGLELLVVTFFRREALVIGLFLFGIYPLTFDRIDYRKKTNKLLIIAWFTVSLSMTAFAIVPPIGSNTNYVFVILAGIISLTVAVLVFIKWSEKNKIVIGIQIILLLLTVLTKVAVVLQKQQHGNILIRVTSWLLLVSSPILPIFTSSDVISKRLFSLSIAFITNFLLLSYTYESLLCVIFFFQLFLWWIIVNRAADVKKTSYSYNVKSRLKSSGGSDFDWSEIWNAYFILFLLTVAFFGMGNVANANSFSLDSVFSFVTVFSPFLMGSLLILKVVIPLLAVACCVRSIQVATDLSPSRFFYLFLVLCDILALHFFFLVRDEGSWLEIGMSLGRFVTAVVTTIGFCVLYVLGTFLTSYEVRWPRKMHFM